MLDEGALGWVLFAAGPAVLAELQRSSDVDDSAGRILPASSADPPLGPPRAAGTGAPDPRREGVAR
jgi:hypothetical protein